MLRSVSLLAVLVLAAGCQSREATTPPASYSLVLPQDPRLVGAWEMTDGPVHVPHELGETTLERMEVIVRPSGGDGAPTPSSFEVRLVQEIRADGEVVNRDATSWCSLSDDRIISCDPGHEGDHSGHGYFGPYSFAGDVLVLDDPDSDLTMRLRRTGGAE